MVVKNDMLQPLHILQGAYNADIVAMLKGVLLNHHNEPVMTVGDTFSSDKIAECAGFNVAANSELLFIKKD